jgi:integrase
MSGIVKHARLESPTARSRLKRGRMPHWQALEEGRTHLGYQVWKGATEGRWLLRRYIGDRRYRVETLGLADDSNDADGERILSYDQAEAKARSIVAKPQAKSGPLTVRMAWERYLDAKRANGQPLDDLLSRGRVHILPELGDLVVESLTAETLRKWHAGLAASRAQGKPKAGVPQYKAAPNSKDGQRGRKASANRVLTMLKACLNHAFDEELIDNRDAWGRRLKPFAKVDTARAQYLTVEQAQRLINASDADFRPLAQAALETGCRYSELARLQVTDFNPDSGTLHIRESKSGKSRHVVLTAEGATFFTQHCAGHDGQELMFRHPEGSGWMRAQQTIPMKAACEHARIKPAVSFHTLRHTWASLSVMAGMPLMVVARNLGHADTRMVERHYGHLAPSFIADAIRAAAPRFGVAAAGAVVPLKAKRT